MSGTRAYRCTLCPNKATHAIRGLSENHFFCDSKCAQEFWQKLSIKSRSLATRKANQAYTFSEKLFDGQVDVHVYGTRSNDHESSLEMSLVHSSIDENDLIQSKITEQQVIGAVAVTTTSSTRAGRANEDAIAVDETTTEISVKPRQKEETRTEELSTSAVLTINHMAVFGVFDGHGGPATKKFLTDKEQRLVQQNEYELKKSQNARFPEDMLVLKEKRSLPSTDISSDMSRRFLLETTRQITIAGKTTRTPKLDPASDERIRPTKVTIWGWFEDWDRTLLANFQQQKKFDDNSGSTATFLVVTPDRQATVMYVGDSQMLFYAPNTSGRADNPFFTGKHVLPDPDKDAKLQRLLEMPDSEAKTLQLRELYPDFYRTVFEKGIFPGLTVTRSFGDFQGKIDNRVTKKPLTLEKNPILNSDIYDPNGSVSIRPTIGEFNLPRATISSFVVIASDGLWDLISQIDAEKIIEEAVKVGSTKIRNRTKTEFIHDELFQFWFAKRIVEKDPKTKLDDISIYVLEFP